MARFDAPKHSYFTALTVRGIRTEARAASISESCRYALEVLRLNRKATPEITATAERLIRDIIHMRRTNQRGAFRTKIAETAASIELTMDAPPKGWTLNAGPTQRLNWDAIPSGSRWK